MHEVRELARRIAAELMTGERDPETDKRLANVFRARWDRVPRGVERIPIKLWFDREQYAELRRQLIGSGCHSVHSYILGRLGLLATPARRPRSRGNA